LIFSSFLPKTLYALKNYLIINATKPYCHVLQTVTDAAASEREPQASLRFNRSLSIVENLITTGSSDSVSPLLEQFHTSRRKKGAS